MQVFRRLDLQRYNILLKHANFSERSWSKDRYAERQKTIILFGQQLHETIYLLIIRMNTNFVWSTIKDNYSLSIRQIRILKKGSQINQIKLIIRFHSSNSYSKNIVKLVF